MKTKTIKNPILSIIIPVFNTEKYSDKIFCLKFKKLIKIIIKLIKWNNFNFYIT